jgi:hypothetical protein
MGKGRRKKKRAYYASSRKAGRLAVVGTKMGPPLRNYLSIIGPRPLQAKNRPQKPIGGQPKRSPLYTQFFFLEPPSGALTVPFSTVHKKLESKTPKPGFCRLFLRAMQEPIFLCLMQNLKAVASVRADHTNHTFFGQISKPVTKPNPAILIARF